MQCGEVQGEVQSGRRRSLLTASLPFWQARSRSWLPRRRSRSHVEQHVAREHPTPNKRSADGDKGLKTSVFSRFDLLGANPTLTQQTAEPTRPGKQSAGHSLGCYPTARGRADTGKQGIFAIRAALLGCWVAPSPGNAVAVSGTPSIFLTAKDQESHSKAPSQR